MKDPKHGWVAIKGLDDEKGLLDAAIKGLADPLVDWPNALLVVRVSKTGDGLEAGAYPRREMVKLLEDGHHADALRKIETWAGEVPVLVEALRWERRLTPPRGA
jgi:hypothetical protein